MADIKDREELVRKLREAGIPVEDGWGETRGKQAKSPLVERQRETLCKLADLLESQIEADQKAMSEAHAALQKLKHGGG